MTHAAAPPFELKETARANAEISFGICSMLRTWNISTKVEPEISSPLFIKQSTLSPIPATADLALGNENVKGVAAFYPLPSGKAVVA